MRRSCQPTRSVRCRRTVRISPSASTRIEATRKISAPWRPPASSCANIIPGGGEPSKSSIISPTAPPSIFARRKMNPSSVASPRRLPQGLRRELKTAERFG